jgi:uncharacterized hydrophobic protein (TIGR00341 family)
MPLRVLELRIGDRDFEDLSDLFADQPVLDIWSAESSEGTAIVWVLVDAAHVEALSDVLMGRLGSGETFRLVVLPVEATLPSVSPPSGPGQEGETEREQAPAELQRISREELYQDLAQDSNLTLTFLAMVGLSAVVAAIGMTRGDVAIIIGAMVIAPLLGPNVALSLASTLGDLDLMKRSLTTLAAGAATVAVISALLGMVFRVDPAGPQILPRTQPEMRDILLALASGAAGALAFTSGVPTAVVGTMVAVALLPPLVGAGLLVGAGYWQQALGGLTLVLTNITCINLAAVGTFLIQQVRPRNWWEAERAKRAVRIAVAIWVTMLLMLLALILLVLPRLGPN